jgi:hypothetical protein
MEKEVNKNIKELKKLGFTSPGFKVPENYFEEFSDGLFSKMKEEEEEEEKEGSIPKTTGFKTPERYFDHLEDSILSTIKNTARIRKSKTRILYTISSVAAALLLYIGTAKYNQSNIVTFESITITDVQAYIEAGNMSLDTYALASLDQDIDMNDLLDDSISDEEINDYLNTIEPEFILIDN